MPSLEFWVIDDLERVAGFWREAIVILRGGTNKKTSMFVVMIEFYDVFAFVFTNHCRFLFEAIV